MICFVLLTGPLLSNIFGTAPWSQYGDNPQHTALSQFATQPPQHILWSAPVDLNPQYSGSDLLIHYGSPLVTKLGTVITSVKTGADDGFEYRAYSPTGSLRWTLATDYSLPPHRWTPSCAGALVLGGLCTALPAGGGTVLLRQSSDAATSAVIRNAFYGNSMYLSDPTTFNSNVKICSPLMAAPSGNIYFGFRVLGSNPANLESGIARELPWRSGGAWVSAAAAANDSGITGPVLNCAPALSNDGHYIYIAVSNGNFGYGYLLCLDAKTLATISKVRLKDPNGNDAAMVDDGTACPMVGPDGDVYFGVLENPFAYNHDRGWMLHFNSTLTVQKPTGLFGWDDTASVVPSAAVPSYTGSSKYLILTKYNNYAGIGGNGVNKVAILDPNATQVDTDSGYPVMKEIITVTGVTPDPDFDGTYPNAVREWCINSAAVDPINRCAIVNSEDGKCYRWNFVTNSLDQVITLTPGVGEAYTPTVIMPNGTSLAINNATLFALGP